MLPETTFFAPAACFVLEEPGMVRWWGRGAADLFCVAAAEVAGKDLWTILAPAAAAALKPLVERAVNGNGFHGECAGWDQASGPRVQVDIEPVAAWAGPGRCWHCSLTYGAVKVDQADPLAVWRKGLLRAQRSQGLGPVINGIIHDFNNYFTAILSNLDMAETLPELPAAARPFVKNARLASQGGALVIRHLQLFSRTGGAQPEVLDPRAMMEELITLMQHCLGRSVQVAKLRVERSPGLVVGRPSWLRQCFINLCLNARESMPCGGELSFTVDLAHFDPAEAAPPRRAGDFARITVADTGHGMPPETLARLEQPFFTSYTEKEVGLGLFGVREILERHEGWMEVESQKAKGTRVHVYLPCRPVTAAPQPLAQDALLLQQRQWEGTERVLVVEPDSATRMLLKAVLGYRGYEVTVAASGQDAQEMAAAAAEPCHLAVVDLDLRDMSAWQLAARLRERWPGAQVILLVNQLTPELMALARRAKAHPLVKPIENQRLLPLVREVLAGQPSGEASGV